MFKNLEVYFHIAFSLVENWEMEGKGMNQIYTRLTIEVDLVISFLRHHELITFYDSMMVKLQVLIALFGCQYKRKKYSEPLTMKLA